MDMFNGTLIMLIIMIMRINHDCVQWAVLMVLNGTLYCNFEFTLNLIMLMMTTGLK